MPSFVIANSTAIGGGNTQQGSGSTYKSIITMGNSSATSATGGYGGAKRGQWYDWQIGTAGVPADNYYEFDICLITFATTGAGVTTQLVSSLSSTFGLDTADFSFQTAIQINSTGEVGITSPVEKWYLGLNQRASYRMVVNPGSNLLWPANSSATNPNGLTLRGRSGAGAVNMTGTVWASE